MCESGRRRVRAPMVISSSGIAPEAEPPVTPLPRPARRRVCIAIVNYGPGWDTLECLESVLRLHHTERQIVVVDNGPDGAASVLLRDWAEGRVEALPRGPEGLSGLVWPPVAKPIPYVLL